MSLYRQTKQQLEFMEDRLDNLKIQGHTMPQSNTVNNSNQLKQKKKPRPMMEAGKIYLSLTGKSFSRNSFFFLLINV